VAADLGAWLCFEDESGQGLRLPKGRTWGRRGRTPVVTVTAAGSKRVSIAALVATRPGTPGRARLIYRTHLDRGPGRHRRKSFAKTEYARLLDGAYQELGGAIVLVWDNLPTQGPASSTASSPRPGSTSTQSPPGRQPPGYRH
jgi:hypothetical protein